MVGDVRVLSVRLPDHVLAEVDRRRIDQGMSRTEWLRWAVTLGVGHAPPVPEPDPAAVQFCTHPEVKRLDGFCVACGTQLVLTG